MKPKRLPKIGTIQTQFGHDFRNACIYMQAPTKMERVRRRVSNKLHNIVLESYNNTTRLPTAIPVKLNSFGFLLASCERMSSKVRRWLLQDLEKGN